MKATLFVLGLVTTFGCSSNPEKRDEQIGQFVGALSKVPFVVKTEKEINDWFDNRPVTGPPLNSDEDPKVHIIVPELLPKLERPFVLRINGEEQINGILCFLQGEKNGPRYELKVGIRALDTPALFECGEIEWALCVSDPTGVSLVNNFKADAPEQKIRALFNKWLKEEIVAVLKSTTNTSGLPLGSEPRAPATMRGMWHNNFASDDGERSIGFIAE